MIAPLLAALLLASAPAQAEDVLLDTMATWAERAVTDLRLGESAAPHRASIAALDYDTFEARAEFGAIVMEGGGRSRPAKVEVVIGDDTLDSARFKAGGRGQKVTPWRRMNLVVEDVRLALERDLWMSTDASYKTALQLFEGKRTAMLAQGGEPPPADWSPAPAVRSIDRSPRPEIDRDLLRSLAQNASAKLLDLPGLEVGEVRVRAIQAHYLLATSEGTLLAQPEGHVIVHARAAARLPDGLEIEDELQWIARTAGDLPDAALILADVERLGRAVLGRRDAAVVDYYEGPVIFEGEAAAAFFRYLLPPQLRGTPPPKQADRTWKQQRRSGPQLGRKLLPDGWSVVDDPTSARQGEATGYVYDREGVQGRRVDLVADGYVRDLLMTRVPRDSVKTSTGHARGLVQSDWYARMTTWSVQPPRNLSDPRFEREVKRAWGAGGQDKILVVRRLARGSEGSLPMPTEASWRFADGHEEPALALQFQQSDRRTLRDIAAVGGGRVRWSYVAGWNPGDEGGRERGAPCLVETPARLLVQNVEAVFPGPQKKPHSYRAPGR